jgi:hypothetical protein
LDLAAKAGCKSVQLKNLGRPEAHRINTMFRLIYKKEKRKKG